MSRTPACHPAAPPSGPKGPVHKLVLAFVWLAVASGAIVLAEPAPVDLLTIGLIALLPIVGLVRVTPPLLIFICLWLVVAAAAYIAAMASLDIGKSAIHTSVSLYLYFAALIFAAFVVKNPFAHTRLIMQAYLWAAFIAAVAGVAGYFDLLPGSGALFTKYGRASGTFKDPNVYGPFLIPALLYAIHLVVHRSVWRAIMPAVMALFLALAILLSFSRGAWAALAIALVFWLYMSFVTAPTNRHRLKLIAFSLAGLFMGACLLTAAMQLDKVSNLFAQRATLDQSYDQGPDGRFGGHEKARGLILDNPLGIGARQFAPNYHSEEAHNVYLSMFLNAGWLGGLFYVLIVGITVLYGLRHGFRRTATQPLFLVIYAAFLGNVVEGLVIDTDHWRHFYLLMGLIWGLMSGDRAIIARPMALDRRRVFEQPVIILPPSRQPSRELHQFRRPPQRQFSRPPPQRWREKRLPPRRTRLLTYRGRR